MLTLPPKNKNKPAIWGGGKVDLRKKRRPPENCPSVSLEQHEKTGRGHVGMFLASEWILEDSPSLCSALARLVLGGRGWRWRREGWWHLIWSGKLCCFWKRNSELVRLPRRKERRSRKCHPFTVFLSGFQEWVYVDTSLILPVKSNIYEVPGTHRVL